MLKILSFIICEAPQKIATILPYFTSKIGHITEFSYFLQKNSVMIQILRAMRNDNITQKSSHLGEERYDSVRGSNYFITLLSLLVDDYY